MASLNNPNSRLTSGPNAQFPMVNTNNRLPPGTGQYPMNTHNPNNGNNLSNNTTNSSNSNNTNISNPNNRIPSGPNTPGSQDAPQQGIKIFIQRDYSEGTAVKFQTRFPPEFEGRIDRQTFEYTIERLNEHFEMAETADCSTYCEGCLACLTAYFIYICTETHYEKHLRKISKFMATQNERIYNPRGIHLTDPILRGLRVIEVTIIDIDAANNTTGNSTTSQPRQT